MLSWKLRLKLNFYIRIAILISLISILSSCAFYKSPSTVVSQLEEKGQAEFGMAYSLKNPVNGYLAYSPLKNVGVFVNGNWGINTFNGVTDSLSFYKDNKEVNVVVPRYNYPNKQIEFAFGGFHQSFDDLRLDLYFGYGFGVASGAMDDYLTNNYSDLFPTEAGAIKAKFDKYFIQSTITKQIAKGKNIVFGFKATQLNFYDFGSKIDYSVFDQYKPTQKKHYVFQPNLSILEKIGLVTVMVQFQANFHHQNEYFSAHKINLNFGIKLNIDELLEEFKQR